MITSLIVAASLIWLLKDTVWKDRHEFHVIPALLTVSVLFIGASVLLFHLPFLLVLVIFAVAFAYFRYDDRRRKERAQQQANQPDQSHQDTSNDERH